MCKLLSRSHACGHQVVVRRKQCFLAKSEFQCTDAETTQVRPSRHNCNICHREQIRTRKAGTVLSSIKAQCDIDSSKDIPERPYVAKSTQLDAATIIANLKALCAKVAAEKHTEKLSRPDIVQQKPIESSNVAASHACVPLPASHKKRHTSTVPTTITEMLVQESEQTAYLGDITLQSPEIKPLQIDNNEEYDPTKSYMAFVKQSGSRQ